MCLSTCIVWCPLQAEKGCDVVMGWYGIDLGVCVHVLFVLHILKTRGNNEGRLWWGGLVWKGECVSTLSCMVYPSQEEKGMKGGDGGLSGIEMGV